MKVFLIATALAGSALAAHADEFSYKGVKLGDTLEQFQAALPLYECRGDSCTYLRTSCAPVHMRGTVDDFIRRDNECKEGASFGGGMVTYGRAKFTEGKMSSLYLVIPTGHMRVVGEALAEKYGKPASVDTRPAKNRMGAEFDNWVNTWTQSEVDLVASKRSAKIDEGSVMIRGAVAKADERARQQEQTKAGAKDF